MNSIKLGVLHGLTTANVVKNGTESTITSSSGRAAHPGCTSTRVSNCKLQCMKALPGHKWVPQEMWRRPHGGINPTATFFAWGNLWGNAKLYEEVKGASHQQYKKTLLWTFGIEPLHNVHLTDKSRPSRCLQEVARLLLGTVMRSSDPL